jgi:RNase P/RNase MRP subunit p29
MPALTLPLQVAYVPPPAPLEDLPAPPPPVVVRKGGVPIAVVALIIAGVLVVGGIVVALVWKGAPPMTAQARTTPEGNDALHLVCDVKNCPDGTVAALGAAKATFAAGQADLTLASPLHLGDNDFALQVTRPGMGRDETMKFVVPVAYRVRADVTTMSGPKPTITIRVEAKPGTDVKVDDKPVALDANGAGAYAIDESVATEGSADESKVVSLDLKYVVSPKGGAPESGTVSARVAVSPLRIDAPGTRATVEEDHVLFAGRGPKGATITVDGNPVTVAADGSFETTVALPAPGDHVVETRGGTTALMPRTVHVPVTRVGSLADAAKAFEQQTPAPIGYDAAMADIAGHTGQPIVVDGTVIDARGSGHRTLVLVDDKRGCKKGPCLARVILGRDMALVRGDLLRAYGAVARSFTTPAGQTVPEIDSQFVVRTKR